MRAQALAAYGGEEPACACCGEMGIDFLTIDHVDGGGRAHRRMLGNQGVYHDLRRNRFPPGFRVLCFNCNLARGLYGACPHEAEQVSSAASACAAHAIAGGDLVRTCTCCKQRLPLEAFYNDRGTRSGRQSRCRACTREASILRLRGLRHEALLHYGHGDPRCNCCGESEERFLALDHISSSAAAPRRSNTVQGGNTFYAWLKKNGFPVGLQVLCHNCNCAKGTGPTCPHRITVA